MLRFTIDNSWEHGSEEEGGKERASKVKPDNPLSISTWPTDRLLLTSSTTWSTQHRAQGYFSHSLLLRFYGPGTRDEFCQFASRRTNLVWSKPLLHNPFKVNHFWDLKIHCSSCCIHLAPVFYPDPRIQGHSQKRPRCENTQCQRDCLVEQFGSRTFMGLLPSPSLSGCWPCPLHWKSQYL